LINNRIVNGGFESGQLLPFSFTGGGSSGVTIVSGNSHSGPFSARISGGSSTITLSQRVPVSPGENFEFFVSLAKVGSNTSPPITISITYTDSNSNPVATALMTNIQSGRLPNNDERDWMEIYRTTTVAPDGTVEALIQITKNGLSNSAAIVVDDVALLAVTAPSVSSGNLNVSGNATVQGNLTVNGTTQLGNETFVGRLRVDEHFTAQSTTSFTGPFNVFTGSVSLLNNLVVGESDIIGSGSLRAGTLDLAGSLGGGIVPNETLIVRHGHIALFGAGHGIILTAPNNTQWLLTVDDDGNLTTTPVS
jgi:hypothetical protein